eukprot:2293372-Heterocapsa_arctica.AAC.1
MVAARQKHASESGAASSASRRKLSTEELTDRVVRAVSRDRRCVALVSTKGPPWYDEYTGEELPVPLVDKGMDVEMGRFEDLEVKDDVPESMAAGKKIISSRWLLKRKKAEARARLVAQELNDG